MAEAGHLRPVGDPFGVEPDNWDGGLPAAPAGDPGKDES